MKFETAKGLDEEKFRRLTGVKRTTFDKMIGILEQAVKDRKTNKRVIWNMKWSLYTHHE